jgi:hypothetical protein
MSENKIEFKLTKDIDGSDIELSNMSLEAIKSFNVLLDSVLKIVSNAVNPNNIRIKIEKGSASISAKCDNSQIETIFADYNDVIEHRSSKKELVHPWRSVQDLIVSNGYAYEINFVKDSIPHAVTDNIKSARPIRSRAIRTQPEFQICFLSGKLQTIGGKNPNFHLIDDEGNADVIRCNESDAIIVKNSLYHNVYISCWRKNVPDKRPLYFYCDIYPKPSIFDEFKSFIEAYDITELDEFLYQLHNKVKEYLSKKDKTHLVKFIKLFNHQSTDVNILKTILVITKAFNDNSSINPSRNLILENLKNKLKTDIF